MTADELFKAGRLGEAIETTTAMVKKSPADEDARFMLFVLLCFAGELERADKQLDVLASGDEKIRTGSLVFHQLLSSEFERRKVYEKGALPVLPPGAPAWLELRVQALKRLSADEPEAADEAITRALEQMTAIHGKLNGEAFEDLRDYDDILCHVFEIYAGGRYIWMPITNVRRLNFTAPSTALDTLWRPAKIEDIDGNAADVHLPILYQPSYAAEQDALRLGRMTDWQERGELYTGLGQHCYMAIREGERVEYSLLDFENLEIETAS